MRPEGTPLSASSSPEIKPSRCPACAGTGFQVIQDQDTGRSYAKSCECKKQGRSISQTRLARIPKRFAACDFDSFWRGPEFDPSVNSAYAKTIEFVSGYTARKVQPNKEFGLLFVGPPGVGKTHLAVAALRRLVNEHGAQGLFADFRDIIKTIQASYNSISQTSEMEVLRPLLQTEILLLDDLGVCRMTEWVRDMVGHIISTRYNEGRVTLITTNLVDDGSVSSVQRGFQGAPSRTAHGDDLARKVAVRPSLADRVGFEIRSRLHEMCELVSIHDEDYRMRVGRHGRRGKP